MGKLLKLSKDLYKVLKYENSIIFLFYNRIKKIPYRQNNSINIYTIEKI